MSQTVSDIATSALTEYKRSTPRKIQLIDFFLVFAVSTITHTHIYIYIYIYTLLPRLPRLPQPLLTYELDG
jgi:hypothetical protein